MSPGIVNGVSVAGLPVDLILQAMPTALVVISVDSGDVLYANAAARRHPFAFASAPVADERGAMGEPLPAEARPHALATAGEPVDHVVVQYRLPDQPTTWLSFRARALDRTRLAVLTFEDVSALHETQGQLRDALVARDELVSMASHELRSPISALGLAVDQMARRSRDLALAEFLRLTALGQRQVHRLKVLVGNLLDVSRLRAGRFELDREPGRLADIVGDACKALREQATAQQTAFSCDIETDGEGSWDVVRMEQVVTNLVVNAFKYGERCPVRVRLHAPDADHVCLSVEDEGPGIPADQREKIFRPFQRASGRYKAQSLGLGLYIVHEIVKAHGGDIEVESRPGLTRFTITLPR